MCYRWKLLREHNRKTWSDNVEASSSGCCSAVNTSQDRVFVVAKAASRRRNQRVQQVRLPEHKHASGSAQRLRYLDFSRTNS